MIKMYSQMIPIPIMVNSTTKSELYNAVLEAMDMLFAYYIMKGMQLTVELPIKLYCNNKGAVDQQLVSRRKDTSYGRQTEFSKGYEGTRLSTRIEEIR